MEKMPGVTSGPANTVFLFLKKKKRLKTVQFSEYNPELSAFLLLDKSLTEMFLDLDYSTTTIIINF